MPCIDLVTEDDISLVTEDDRLLVTEDSFCPTNLVRIHATAFYPGLLVSIIDNGITVEIQEVDDVFAEVIT